MPIKTEDFDEWQDNPVTQYVIKYLTDSIKEASEMMADDIANGAIVSESDQIKTATMCLTLREIAELELETIESFYETGEEE